MADLQKHAQVLHKILLPTNQPNEQTGHSLGE
jgi:hypothetical protein